MMYLKPNQDEEASKMSRRGDSAETTRSSSSSSYYDNIDWSAVSEWCRNFLDLSDAELDSLWYERLASTALYHDDKVDKGREFYQLALEKEKPSWLCHRGLGSTYAREEKLDEAMKCYELAIAEAEKDGAVPKPEPKDVFAIHLFLGNCALDIGDLKKAAEYFLQAGSSEDVSQAMEAQLGQMKAVMRSPDPHDATTWLQDKLSEETEGRRLCDILNMAAREDDNGDFIPRMFTLASEKPDTLKGVVRAMETATVPSRPKPGAESEATNPILDEETVGVLKYYRGLATYIYRHEVASETVDPFREALKLWEECCDQLSSIDTYNAYIIRKLARVKIAQHYFEDMLARDRLDDVDKLAQLARSENQAQGGWEWEASGFLSALYAHHGDMSHSRAALVRKIRLGLEVLSDETPQNDEFGFMCLWGALVQQGDFVNATIALLLRVSPDMVADALAFKPEDVRVSEGQENQQLLDQVRKLAEKTLEVTRSQLSETSPQHQRLKFVREHIDTCLSASSNDAVGGSEGQSQLTPHDSETVAAYRLIQERLRACQEHIAEVSDWTWSCDGRTVDGKKCMKAEVYHCVYCPNIDFCDDCLGRLRDPERSSNMESTVCSSRHRWLKLPLPSSGLYVGPQAKSLRTPKVQQRHEDHQILEVSGVGDATVNVKDWMADIARAWDIVLDGEKGGADNTDAS